MNCKEIALGIVRSVVVMALLLPQIFPGESGKSLALYNDPKFDNYENMRDKGGIVKYTVPNLFRNDVPFKNVKRFPLVVQNSVEYVPLEMFFGLTDVNVNTSLPNGDFYINNTAEEKYVSFDVSEDRATSHLNRPFTIETKVFYTTRYLPVRTVCDLLGISYDVYDDKENGVFVVRMTNDDQKIPIDELVKMYSPVKIEPDDQTQNPDEGVLGENIPVPPENSGENPPEKIPEVKPPVQPNNREDEAEKQIELAFYGDITESTDVICDVLDRYGVKGTFFCTENSILEYSETVRKLYISGHDVGIYLSDNGIDIGEYAENINNALEFVSKRRSRMAMTDESFDKQNTSYYLALEGISNYFCDLFVGGEGDSYESFLRLTKKINNEGKNGRTVRVTVGFLQNDVSVGVLKSLLSYINSNESYSVVSVKE